MEIRAGSNASYLLAYYPSEHAHDGKWRKIEVRTARPNLNLRHRSGYFAVADAPPASAEASLRAAVWNPLDSTGIGLDAWLEGSTPHVRVHGGSLAAEPRGDRFACPLEIVFVQAGAAGKQLDGVRDSVPLLLTAQALEQALVGGFACPLNGAIGSVRLPLVAGAGSVR